MADQFAHQIVSAVEKAFIDFCKIDDATASLRPSPERWTIKEVIGHLIDSASNNHQRFVRAQSNLEKNLVFPAYAQNEWVSVQRYNSSDWQSLIVLWRAYNMHLAHIIREMDESMLVRSCVIGTYSAVSLQFLIEDYFVHMNGHLAKINARLPFERV
jgi:DinB superfamily